MKATTDGVIRIIKGDLFSSECQTLVNAVNCVGVMGSGIALEFKKRYPLMFAEYKALCDAGKFTVGKLWLYNKEEGRQWVLNFPTKYSWIYKSKISYIDKGLEKLLASYKSRKIESIAFPFLGTGRGGLDRQAVIRVMIKHLSKLDIPVEIYTYD